ncbi:MAG TPA: hypothetical protein VK133_04020 [Amoebophilaceae bacterium]|nr:hypothetical protein [Amoebophilaceae bacterium]
MYKLFVFYSRRPFFLILSCIVAVSGDCSKIKPKNKLGQGISQTGALELIKPTQVKGMPPTKPPDTLSSSSKKRTRPSKEGSSPIQATNIPSRSTPSNGKGTTIPSQGIGSPIQETNIHNKETKPLPKEIIKIPKQRIVFVVKENSSIEHIIKADQSMLPVLPKAQANQTEVVLTNSNDAPQVRKHLKELWKWIVEYRQSGNHQNVLNTKIKGYDLKEKPNPNDGSSANSGSYFVLIKKEQSKGADPG